MDNVQEKAFKIASEYIAGNVDLEDFSKQIEVINIELGKSSNITRSVASVEKERQVMEMVNKFILAVDGESSDNPEKLLDDLGKLIKQLS